MAGKLVEKKFRLTNDEVETIKREADRRGCTQTEVIRSCISNLGGDTREPASGDTLSKVISMLESELEIKNAQISDLSRALAAAQETAKAAQVLHAQERRALESPEQKSRWQRVRDAWRG